ncbi:MAG TPA: ABC transporter ATP-binding protein [Bacteroidia bacterium]|nr:ABC transporter ATP-binding protein [Bacteroidia bacterium]
MNQTNDTFSLQSLSIGYAGHALIENVSLQIQSPCLVGLIGNNGCGKTTLLKTISGLQKKIAGAVFYKGQDISVLTNKEISQLITFGFAFNSNTFPISVYELVSMGRYPYINSMATLTKTDHQIISDAIYTLGIPHLKDKLITAISEGERQKAYIAKALAQQTPVLLLDEPTAFLDYTSKKQFFKTIKENVVAKNNITIVSSHDIDFLSRNADYLIMIHDDKTVEFDKTETIVRSHYYSAHFNY